MAKRILVVDDLPDWRDTLAGLLSDEGYEVVTAGGQNEAKQVFANNPPHLAVLDVRLDEREESNTEGLDLMRWINKTYPSTMIIILTAYGTMEMVQEALRPRKDGTSSAFSFVEKSQELKGYLNLLNQIRLAFSAIDSSIPAGDECHLVITLDDERKLWIEASGALKQTTEPVKLPLSGMDILRLSRRARNIGVFAFSFDPRVRQLWRSEARDLGQDLFEKLFELQSTTDIFATAKGTVRTREEKLKIHFRCPRDYLGMPFEFLCEKGGDYFAFRYPLSRSLLGGRALFGQKSFSYLTTELREQEESLKILLVAADTEPPLKGVNVEIAHLNAKLPAALEERGVKCEITFLSGREATYECVCDELRNCRYHIFHYAGHGSHDLSNPDNSALYLRKNKARRAPLPLTAQQLNLMNLHDCALQFVYLSCCYGTATASKYELLDDDFLGVADGFVQAGIPRVLGYRWPVSDEGAQKMALAFYEALFGEADGDISTALLHARRKAANVRRGRNDATWLSPVLLLQAEG